jgi:hypothetical protein
MTDSPTPRLGWATHLTQRLRERTDVTACLKQGAEKAAAKAGKAEAMPNVWGCKEIGLAWGGMWLLSFLICLVGRHV